MCFYDVVIDFTIYALTIAYLSLQLLVGLSFFTERLSVFNKIFELYKFICSDNVGLMITYYFIVYGWIIVIALAWPVFSILAGILLFKFHKFINILNNNKISENNGKHIQEKI